MIRYRLWISIAALALVACGGSKNTRDKVDDGPAAFDHESLNNWIFGYYLNPQPERTPDAIRFMADEGLINENSRAQLVAFFGVVFRNNESRLDDWLKSIDDLEDEHLAVVWQGVWFTESYTGVDQALWYTSGDHIKKILQAAGERSRRARQVVEYYLKRDPPPMKSIDIDSPAVLEMLWYAFYASGDPLYVKRIIGTLDWINDKTDVQRVTVAGAARLSLQTNAVDHAKVLEIAKGQLAVLRGEARDILDGIVTEAERRRANSKPPF